MVKAFLNPLLDMNIHYSGHIVQVPVGCELPLHCKRKILVRISAQSTFVPTKVINKSSFCCHSVSSHTVVSQICFLLPFGQSPPFSN